MKRLLPSILLLGCSFVTFISFGQVRSQRPLLRQVLDPVSHTSTIPGKVSATSLPSRDIELIRQDTLHPSAGQKSELIGRISPEISTAFLGNAFNVQAPSSNTLAISNEGWIIAIVNSSISYYDQNGNIALDSEPLGDFYSYLELPGTIYNPQVVFDPVSERFIFVALHGSDPSSSRLIISFSYTQDPADGWWSYSFDNIAEEPNRWMGEMRIGISATDLYITGKLFEENGNDYLSTILQFHKGTAYAGENLSYNYWSDIIDEQENQVGTLIPVSDGFETGYGPGIYFLGTSEEGGNTLQFFEVTADSDQGPFLSGFYYEYPAYGPGEHGEQSGSSTRLDVRGCQIQSAFIAEDVLHFVHHNSLADGSNGIRYVKLDLGEEMLTWIELGGEGQTFAYPSITPLQLSGTTEEATLLNFSHSSSTVFPSMYMLSLDQDLNPSFPVLVKAGESSITSSEELVPWGAYSGISRRHNAETATAWIFGSFGKAQTYGNWVAEVASLGEGLNWPCQNAQLISCGEIVSGTTNTNPQLLPACIGTETDLGGQWYRMVGHGGGVILSTCNPNTDIDTRVLVFGGNCTNLNCLELEELASCDDNGSNPNLGFYAVDGEEYFIYITAADNNGGDFELSISCKAQEGTCTGDQILTDCEGSFVDGSEDNPYSNDLACSWTISPYAAATITLNFTNFSTEEGFDYVSVYDGTGSTDSLIAKFSGNAIPEEIVARTGHMYVLFESDGSFTDAGWIATYSCTEQQTPSVNFKADTLQGIAPFTVNFTNLTENLPADFLWEFGDGNTATSVNPTHTYTEAGTYTVSLSATNLAGEDSKTITNYIVVEPNVVAPESNFTQSEICGTFPLNVSFEDLSTNEPTAWIWDFGNGQTSTEQNPSITYTEAGTYTVKLTTSNEAGENVLTRSSLITVIGPLEINAPDGTSACLGATLSLEATGADSYTWVGPNLSSTVDSSVLAAPLIAGTYEYVVTGTTNGCISEPDSISLSFVTVPMVSISASSTITCLGEAVKLIGSGATTYSWEGAGLTSNTGSQVIANPILPGAYVYELVGTQDGCPSPTQAITVLFNSVPEVSLSPAQADICEGDSVRLVANGGGIYAWEGPGLESFEQSEIWVKPGVGTTTYSVSSTVNGCQSEVQTSSIRVDPSPTVSLEVAPTSLCLGDTLILVGTGADAYQWSGLDILLQRRDSLIALPLEIGSIDYQLFGLINDCSSEVLEHTILVKNNALSVSIEASNCPGPGLEFQATVVNGGMTADEITWFLNEVEVGKGANISISNANNGDQIYCTVIPIDPLACTTPSLANSNVITIDCLMVDTEEPNSWSAAQLLPNPNRGQFTLGITHQIRQNLQIDIYNTLGQLIHQQMMQTAPGRQNLPINIQQQANGLYWLVISSATERQTLSFLKQ